MADNGHLLIDFAERGAVEMQIAVNVRQLRPPLLNGRRDPAKRGVVRLRSLVRLRQDGKIGAGPAAIDHFFLGRIGANVFQQPIGGLRIAAVPAWRKVEGPRVRPFAYHRRRRCHGAGDFFSNCRGPVPEAVIHQRDDGCIAFDKLRNGKVPKGIFTAGRRKFHIVLIGFEGPPQSGLVTLVNGKANDFAILSDCGRPILAPAPNHCRQLILHMRKAARHHGKPMEIPWQRLAAQLLALLAGKELALITQLFPGLGRRKIIAISGLKCRLLSFIIKQICPVDGDHGVSVVRHPHQCPVPGRRHPQQARIMPVKHCLNTRLASRVILPGQLINREQIILPFISPGRFGHHHIIGAGSPLKLNDLL